MRNRSRLLNVVWLTLSIAISCQAGWHADKVISEKNFDNFYTTQGVGVAPDGTTYIVYGGDNLRFATRNGSTWNTEIVDPTPGSGDFATINIMPNSDICILYSRLNRLACAFRASGETHWDIQVISTIRPKWISSEVDTNGKLHSVVFDGSTFCPIYLTNQDSAWTQTQVSETPTSIRTCSIALTSSNQPAISYSQNGTMMLAYKTGNTWSNQPIYHTGNQVTKTSIAFDSWDMPHIALNQRDISSHQSFLRVANYTGSTWEVEDIDSNEDGAQEGILYPRLMIDSNDHYHLLYGAFSDADLKYALNDGSGWSLQIVETASTGYLASMTLDTDNNPEIAAFIGWDIRHYTENGGGWTPSVVDTSQFPHILSSSITLDTSNEPHLALQIGTGLYHGSKEGTEWNLEIIDDPPMNASGHFNDIVVDDTDDIHISFNNNMGGVSPAQYTWFDGSQWQMDYLGSAHHYTTLVMGLALNDVQYPYFIGYDYDALKFYFYSYDGSDWLDYLIDDSGDVGEYSSIVVDHTGTTHVSYMEHDNYDLRYAFGLDGSWTIETVDDVNFSGMYNDIAVDAAGIPFISYYNAGLRMASRIGGTWSSELVSAEVRLGDTAISIDTNGFPHIVADNKYCVWDGAQWGITDYDLYRVERTDLALDQSNIPHILYYDAHADLNYITLDVQEPVITDITPDLMYQELDYPGIVISGSGFTDVTSITLGDGIHVSSWCIVSDTEIAVDAEVYAFASLGFRGIGVNTSTGNDVYRNCLEIRLGPPHIQSVEPTGYPRGETIDIMISGINFSEVQSLGFDSGITVDEFNILSPDRIDATLTINAGATLGDRDVSITSPAGTTICSSCFQVEEELSGTSHFVIDSIPSNVYTDTPFMIHVRAVDAAGRTDTSYNDTLSLTDTVTGTLDPTSLQLVNGEGSVEATILTGAHKNQIHATYSSYLEGFSNEFNVLQALADCDYHTIENPVYLTDASSAPSRHIRVSDEGTVWVAFGEDNLWAAKRESGTWDHVLVDPEPGVGWACSLALDPEGNPHISYSAHHYFTDYSVKFASLTEYGWRVETIEDLPCTNTAVDIGSDGKVHLCYGSNTDQKYAVKDENGWQINSLIGQGAQECSLVVDASNQPHMVFPSSSGFQYFGYLNGTWTNDTLALGNGSSCSINVDASNNPHVVARAWLGGTDYTIAYGHWTGSAWETENLPGDNNCTDMNILFNDANQPIIVGKYNGFNGQKSFRVFTYDGSTWSHTDLSLGDDDAGNIAAVDIDSSNTLHFHHFNRTEWGLEYDQKSASDWTREIHQRSGQISSGVDILVNSQDVPIVGYSYATHTFDEWFLSARFASYAGNEWITDQTDIGWSTCLSFGLQSDDAPAFVFSQVSGQDVLHYQYKDGSNWVDDVVYTSDQSYQTTVLLHDSVGNPLVAFKNDNAIKIASRTGTNWVVDDLMTMSNGDKGPSMAMGPDGIVRIVFESNEIEYSKMYLATHSGSGWDTEVVYDEPVGDMKLAIDSTNSPHIMFQKSTGEMTYLYQTGSTWQEELIDDDFYSSSYSLGTIVTDSLDRPNCCYSVNFDLYGDYDVRYAIRTGRGWQTYTVDVNGSTGPSCSMALDSTDTPHFAYQEHFGKDLRYSNCGIFTPPEIDTVIPASAFPGASIQGTILDGFGLYTVTLVDFGDGITVNSISNPTNSTIIADIQVDPEAVPGARDVRVVSPAGTDICSDCFVVLESGDPPVIETVDPPDGLAGDQYRVLIQGTHFSNTEFISFGSELDVDTFEVLSDEAIEAEVYIHEDAVSGTRDITLVTTHGQTVCIDCFTVIQGNPTPTPTPGEATNTPVPTDTPQPTNTPSATWTPTPNSPTATSTPDQCTTTGVTVEMPLEVYHGGDACWCRATVCNAETGSLNNYPLFVILDVYGLYFFAPSFKEEFDMYLEQYPVFPVGETVVTVLPAFTWPSDVGSANGIFWYGALTNPEITDVFGDLGTFEFGWE